MAIQIPNPGTGNGASGDNEFVLWSKVKDNFNNSAHAASRLVGIATGQIPLAEGVAEAFLSGLTEKTKPSDNLNEFTGAGVYQAHGMFQKNTPLDNVSSSKFKLYVNKLLGGANPLGTQQIAIMTESIHAGDVYSRIMPTYGGDGAFTNWAKYYTSRNTTVDSNKNIKTSSPVVRVFSDHLDKIHQANDLPIKYTRNGVGDYTIEGTTGLRENDWQIVIPEDDHRNQLIAFTIQDDNGTIRLKTYKRTFNMTTFMFEPDLNQPLDIPDGRWVDLHFNDLPQEELPPSEDFQAEEVVLDK